MAIFICDNCGYQQSVAEEYLHRTARCPECRQLSMIGDEEVCSMLPPPQTSRFETIRNWAPLTGFTLFLGLTSWGFIAAMHFEHPRPVAATSIGPSAEPTPALSSAGGHASPPNTPTPPSTPETNHVLQDSQVAGHQVTKLTDELAPPNAARETPEPIDNAFAEDRQSDLQYVAEGKLLFEHRWVPNDRLAGGGDGLGPVFNGRSCVECHFQAGPGGSGTNAHSVQIFEVLPDHDGGPVPSGVIHTSATHDDLMESKAHAMFAHGSGQVPFRNQNGGVEKFDAMRTVFINTPALWGNGVIDQITDRDLRGLKRNQNMPGRFRELPDGTIGKFGWKSQIATLRDFVATACAGELGLSNAVHAQHAPKKYEADPQAKHDLSDQQVESLVQFVASLPAPRQVIPADTNFAKNAIEGHKLFSSIGCINCHTQDVGVAHNVFSDFQLHMISGSGVSKDSYYPAKFEPVYTPSSSFAQLGEWKTPPLWGVADTAPYWHDGSAPTLRDAIKKHEKEGKPSADGFERLVAEQQGQLIAFLSTLRAPIPQR